ncbi:Glutathione S-transferase F9, partial [Zea mays]
TDVVGRDRPRPRLLVREGRRVPAHPRRLLPRHQATAPVPQAPAARRGAHLRGRQRLPRRVEEDLAPHRRQVQEPGVQGPVRPERAGAGLHRAVAADGGAELRRPQRRHGLQPRLPAARHAARRQGRRRPPGGDRDDGRRWRRCCSCSRRAAGSWASCWTSTSSALARRPSWPEASSRSPTCPTCPTPTASPATRGPHASWSRAGTSASGGTPYPAATLGSGSRSCSARRPRRRPSDVDRSQIKAVAFAQAYVFGFCIIF